MLRSMRPVVAAIKDKDVRARVTDALIASIRDQGKGLPCGGVPRRLLLCLGRSIQYGGRRGHQGLNLLRVFRLVRRHPQGFQDGLSKFTHVLPAFPGALRRIFY